MKGNAPIGIYCYLKSLEVTLSYQVSLEWFCVVLKPITTREKLCKLLEVLQKVMKIL